MIDSIQSAMPAPASIEPRAVPAATRPARSVEQVVFTWIGRTALVGGGLVVGAVIGLIVALMLGLVDIRC